MLLTNAILLLATAGISLGVPTLPQDFDTASIHHYGDPIIAPMGGTATLLPVSSMPAESVISPETTTPAFQSDDPSLQGKKRDYMPPSKSEENIPEEKREDERRYEAEQELQRLAYENQEKPYFQRGMEPKWESECYAYQNEKKLACLKLEDELQKSEYTPVYKRELDLNPHAQSDSSNGEVSAEKDDNDFQAQANGGGGGYRYGGGGGGYRYGGGGGGYRYGGGGGGYRYGGGGGGYRYGGGRYGGGGGGYRYGGGRYGGGGGGYRYGGGRYGGGGGGYRYGGGGGSFGSMADSDDTADAAAIQSVNSEQQIPSLHKRDMVPYEKEEATSESSEFKKRAMIIIPGPGYRPIPWYRPIPFMCRGFRRYLYPGYCQRYYYPRMWAPMTPFA